MATTIWPYARSENIPRPGINFSGIKPTSSDTESGAYSFNDNEIPHGASLKLNIKVLFPQEVLNNGSNLKETSIDICAELTSKTSRYQGIFILESKPDTNTLGTYVELPFDVLGDTLEIKTFAVLNADVYIAQRDSKFASIRGDIVGSYEDITITLRASTKRSGSDFDVTWESFKRHDETKNMPNAVHYVDIDTPRILINDDMKDELKRIMSSEQPGPQQILRDCFFSPIAADCLEQLLRHALTKAKKNRSLDGLAPVYERIVQDLAPLLMKTPDYQDAISALEEMMLDPEETHQEQFEHLIQTQLPLIAQEYTKIRPKLEKHALKIAEAQQ